MFSRVYSSVLSVPVYGKVVLVGNRRCLTRRYEGDELFDIEHGLIRGDLGAFLGRKKCEIA